MLDPLGNVATWNSGAEKTKQYQAAEIIGKNFACFYTAEDVAAGKPQKNLAEARRKGLGPRSGYSGAQGWDHFFCRSYHDRVAG